MIKHSDILDSNFLKDFNFREPFIQEYSKDNFSVLKENRVIRGQEHNIFVFKQDGLRWMAWDKTINKEVFEVFSHYYLARGHVICTGMGFLLRENWLLSNPNVYKITVIEKNKNIIEYHKVFNPNILRRIEVIHEDAYIFKGKCDTLLIDNFEGGIGFENEFLLGAKIICDNIDHELAWMWPMELILNNHYKNYIGLSLSDLYYNIKKYFNLQTFPNLDEEHLFNFCHKFFIGNFDSCHFNSNILHDDRDWKQLFIHGYKDKCAMSMEARNED